MENSDIIIVLGSPNDAEGNLYSTALGRCEQAMAFWRDNPDCHILLTGGYGDHFNTTTKPHAQYLQDHMIAHGIPREQILEFAESRNTLEDAALAKPIVMSHGAGAVVAITSDFHVPRARFIFTREFADTPVSVLFLGVLTDEDQCEFDLVSQKAHERKALKKLMEEQESL